MQSYLGVNEYRGSLGADFCLGVWPPRRKNVRAFTPLNSSLSALISLEGAVASTRGAPRAGSGRAGLGAAWGGPAVPGARCAVASPAERNEVRCSRSIPVQWNQNIWARDFGRPHVENCYQVIPVWSRLGTRDLEPWFSKCGLWPAALASPGNP